MLSRWRHRWLDPHLRTYPRILYIQEIANCRGMGNIYDSPMNRHTLVEISHLYLY